MTGQKAAKNAKKIKGLWYFPWCSGRSCACLGRPQGCATTYWGAPRQFL